MQSKAVEPIHPSVGQRSWPTGASREEKVIDHRTEEAAYHVSYLGPGFEGPAEAEDLLAERDAWWPFPYRYVSEVTAMLGEDVSPPVYVLEIEVENSTRFGILFPAVSEAQPGNGFTPLPRGTSFDGALKEAGNRVTELCLSCSRLVIVGQRANDDMMCYKCVTGPVSTPSRTVRNSGLNPVFRFAVSCIDIGTLLNIVVLMVFIGAICLYHYLWHLFACWSGVEYGHLGRC